MILCTKHKIRKEITQTVYDEIMENTDEYVDNVEYAAENLIEVDSDKSFDINEFHDASCINNLEEIDVLDGYEDIVNKNLKDEEAKEMHTNIDNEKIKKQFLKKRS